VDLDGAARGTLEPSSEWRFHRDIYRLREDAGAVVHAHPAHATSLACLGRGIPSFHYEVALAGGSDIRCARYATFGTQELSDHVMEALQGRRACLMANHGLVSIGADLPAALALAHRVEHLAQMYRQCLQVDEPDLLGEEEMARVVEKFRTYGQPR
jgi:L-fuculose-phosphate aldolase